MNLLDLVALGTVCDVVPLTGLNRAFVKQGLKILNKQMNLGLKSLCDAAQIVPPFDPYHLGFILGPRINAGGRMGPSTLGASLLSSDDLDETVRIASQLDAFNAERQMIEKSVLDRAFAQASKQDNLCLTLSDAQWHEGVLGIVAGRLKDTFYKPVVVVAWDVDKGIGKGSARSIEGFDIGAAIRQAVDRGFLNTGGGHAMAGGLSVTPTQWPAFQSFMNQKVQQELTEDHFRIKLNLDGCLHIQAANTEIIEQISKLEPYGMGNPMPRFVIPRAFIRFSDVVGSNHIRCTLSTITGQNTLSGIAFRALGTPLGQHLLDYQGRSLALAGTLRHDSWQGQKRIKFHIEDACIAHSS